MNKLTALFVVLVGLTGCSNLYKERIISLEARHSMLHMRVIDLNDRIYQVEHRLEKDKR
jgi:hypothetical protein